MRPRNKKALPQSGKNLVIRASLVEGASEVRRRNKDKIEVCSNQRNYRLDAR